MCDSRYFCLTQTIKIAVYHTSNAAERKNEGKQFEQIRRFVRKKKMDADKVRKNKNNDGQSQGNAKRQEDTCLYYFL